MEMGEGGLLYFYLSNYFRLQDHTIISLNCPTTHILSYQSLFAYFFLVQYPSGLGNANAQGRLAATYKPPHMSSPNDPFLHINGYFMLKQIRNLTLIVFNYARLGLSLFSRNYKVRHFYVYH